MHFIKSLSLIIRRFLKTCKRMNGSAPMNEYRASVWLLVSTDSSRNPFASPTSL